MPTVTRLVTKYDVLRVLNKRDASLKALPVPLFHTTAGTTTTVIDTKLGRGTTQANKYDARGIEIMSELSGVTITSSSIADPTVITTASAHGYGAGLVHNVVISGHIGSVPDINGEWEATQTGASTATIPVNVTTGGTGGTITELSDYVAVDDGGFNGTSTLTFSPALTVLAAVGVKYLLYPHGVSGDVLDRVADEILRQTDAPYHWFPSLVPDSDLSGSFVDDWWGDIGGDTPSTREYATTSTNRWVTQQIYGEQSLHIVESGTDGGVKSDAFYMGDTETVVVFCLVQALVGTLTVQLYDETNSATIGTAVTIDEPAWKEVRFQETIPASCEQVTMRFSGSANLDEYYVSSPIIVQATGTSRAYEAPSWLVSEAQVRQAFYMPQGVASEDSDTYVALSRRLQSALAPRPTFINEARGVNPFKVVLEAVQSRPVGLEVTRGFDAFVHNATTTTCDRDYLVAAILARFYRDWDETADFRRWARRRRARELALGYNLKEVRIVPNELTTV